MSVGQRLRQERERLGLSQEALGQAGGVLKRSVIYYERDDRSPDAKFFAAVAEAGVDVAYVITGVRTVPATDALPPRERTLLEKYRETDEEGQRSIERSAMLEAQRQASPVVTAKRKRAA